MGFPHRLSAPALLCAALLLGACSHYRLGAPAGPAFTTVFVAPVTNETFAPQAAAPVTARVREALARDGRLQLAPDALSAGAVLTVRLVGYERDVVAARRDDTGLARKYAVTLSAEVTVADRSGRRLLDRRPVRVSRDVFLDSGQQPTEAQTLPLLAGALASEVAHVVLDMW